MQLIESILYDCVYHSAPIILCVLGGMFAYKANVLNIALEGMMLNGAFMSILVYHLTSNMLLTLLLTVGSTLIYGMVFSYLGVTMKGNVIIIGLAINMISTAIAGFVLVIMKSANIILQDFDLNALKINIPIVEDIPVLGSILSGHPTITYISFLMIFLMYVLMYHTKFGIYVRVVGESEEAAKSIGLRTDFYKYAAVLIGAVGCALGGMNLSLERLGLFTNDMVAGRGFIAVAAIYCGQGKPVQSACYAILFGLSRALAINLSVYAGNIAGLFDCLPYILMIAILAVASYMKRKNIKVRGF